MIARGQEADISLTDPATFEVWTELETAITTGEKRFVVSHIKAGQWGMEQDRDEEVQHLMRCHRPDLCVSERKWFHRKPRSSPPKPQYCGKKLNE